MNSQYITLLLVLGLFLVILTALGLRLIWLMGRNMRRRKEESAKGRDLLLDTLHAQTVKEREAREEQRQSVLAFEQLNALHRTIMTHLSIGILVLDDLDHIQLANPPALALLGLEGVTGQDLMMVAPALGDLYKSHRENPDANPRELLWPMPGGSRLLMITAEPLPESRYLLTLADKTRERDLEEKVRYKRDLELMGEMAGGVTHEIKNALATISGHAQLLPDHEDGGHGKAIIDETDRLLHFVREFMRSSKDIQLYPQDLDIADWFAEQRLIWKSRPEDNRVTFDTPGEPLALRADPQQLEILLGNLIRNGLQSGGETAEVGVAAEKHKDQIVIHVIDNGPGFAREVRNKLFVPFVTSKQEGSGLGLFHCRKIVMQHGGRIEINPDPPTRVCCFFPCKGLGMNG